MFRLPAQDGWGWVATWTLWLLRSYGHMWALQCSCLVQIIISVVKWDRDKQIMITDHWSLFKWKNGSLFLFLFRLFWILLWPMPHDAKCRQFGWDFISSEKFWIIDIKTNWIRSFCKKSFYRGWHQEKICGSIAWCLALLHAFQCFYSGLSKSVHVFCECLW